MILCELRGLRGYFAATSRVSKCPQQLRKYPPFADLGKGLRGIRKRAVVVVRRESVVGVRR